MDANKLTPEQIAGLEAEPRAERDRRNQAKIDHGTAVKIPVIVCGDPLCPTRSARLRTAKFLHN
jgi:hypothetical protein